MLLSPKLCVAAACAVLAACGPRGPSIPSAPVEPAPRTSPAIVDGVAIAYHTYGSGPVVFAHPGGPGIEWTYLRMPELEKVATVVYLEPFGTGASGRLADRNGYTFENYVKAVDGVRAHLGIDRFVLLGHSHGGFVAQAYALAHPEHLRGLVLYDTAPTTGPEWQRDVEANLAWFAREPWFAEASAALASETAMQSDEAATENLRREMPLYFAEWTARSAEYEPLRGRVRMWVAPGLSGTDPAASPDVGVAAPFDVRPRLPQIAAPTLVVVGAKDFVCSEKMARVLAGAIPGARLAVLPHSGHMGHIEEPVAHARAIGEFLAALPQ